MRKKLREVLGLDEDRGIQQAAYDEGTVTNEDSQPHSEQTISHSTHESPVSHPSPPPSFAMLVTEPDDLTTKDVVTVCYDCELVWITRSVTDAEELAQIHRDREGHGPDTQVAANLLLEGEVWTVSCSDCGLRWFSLVGPPTVFVEEHVLHTGHAVEDPTLRPINAVSDASIYEVPSSEDTAMNRVHGVCNHRDGEDTDGSTREGFDEDRAGIERWGRLDTELTIPTIASVFDESVPGTD